MCDDMMKDRDPPPQVRSNNKDKVVAWTEGPRAVDAIRTRNNVAWPTRPSTRQVQPPDPTRSTARVESAPAVWRQTSFDRTVHSSLDRVARNRPGFAAHVFQQLHDDDIL